MKKKKSNHHNQRAFLFDLDGTLIDSVYEHTIAWRQALQEIGVIIPTASIHRRIGMSGRMLLKAFEREAETKFSSHQAKRAEKLHADHYQKLSRQISPLPGADDLLKRLLDLRIPCAIATSGGPEDAKKPLSMLRYGSKIPIVTKEDVKHAKPEPDLFLTAAAKLKVELEDCVVVGDSVWDLLAAQRARALPVGLLCGGVGENELERAGAYRVYRDPADLLAHLDELGVQEKK